MEKAIIISLMAATLSFADCKSSCNHTVNNALSAVKVSEMGNFARACVEAKMMWHFYENAKMNCVNNEREFVALQRIDYKLRDIYFAMCETPAPR